MSDLPPAPIQPNDPKPRFMAADGLPVYQTVYVLMKRITDTIADHDGFKMEYIRQEFAGQVFIRESRAISEVATLTEINRDLNKISKVQLVEYYYEEYTAT